MPLGTSPVAVICGSSEGALVNCSIPTCRRAAEIEESTRCRAEKDSQAAPPGVGSGKHHVSSQFTLFLLCLVGFIEGADMQLLPASFGALEADLDLSPSRLGQMSLAQSLFMATTSPYWGWLADRQSRKDLLVLSCSAWGVLTFLLATATSVEAMFLLRCAHGATLSSLSPIAQSMIADITESHSRGEAFGWMYCAIALGQISSSLFGTAIAKMQLLPGVRGWRLAFCAVAAISVVAAVIIFHFMDDPPREEVQEKVAAVPVYSASAHESGLSFCLSSSRAELQRVRGLMQIPTFKVMVLQGVFGSVPWNALGFLAMYLQCSGHQDTSAATIVSFMLFGRACGGIVGGKLGDLLARHSPSHGRPSVAVMSVLLGTPFTAALIYFAAEGSVLSLSCLTYTLGLVASWCSTGVVRPILSEVVHPRGRASVIAWMSAMEGSSAALFGAPVVGILAEQVFGYRKPAKLAMRTSAPTLQVSHEIFSTTIFPNVSTQPLDAQGLQAKNAGALSQAMLWGTIPPWLICAILFSRLYITYGPDVKRMQNAYAEV